MLWAGSSGDREEVCEDEGAQCDDEGADTGDDEPNGGDDEGNWQTPCIAFSGVWPPGFDPARPGAHIESEWA